MEPEENSQTTTQTETQTTGRGPIQSKYQGEAKAILGGLSHLLRNDAERVHASDPAAAKVSLDFDAQIQTVLAEASGEEPAEPHPLAAVLERQLAPAETKR